MIIIHERCAGIDVHKRSVVVCCLWNLQDGTHRQETRTFGTTTSELLTLLDWLQSWEITCIAMESTGENTPPPMLQIGGGTVRSGCRRDRTDAEDHADLLF